MSEGEELLNLGTIYLESDSEVVGEAGPSTVVTALPRRDDFYYFESVVFQVGNCTFKVPKNGFQIPGTIFEAMFSLPGEQTESNIEGTSDENPIFLSGVDENNFRAFLSVLYPFNGSAYTQDEYSRLVGALDLATMWEFKTTRQDMITSLSPIIERMNVVEVILLAKKYRVPEWLRSSYSKLAQQTTVLEMDALLHPFTLDNTTTVFLTGGQICLLIG
ncbi:hypothetical protein BDZ97DRAFT_1366163 [Flammula alnicola]|nr:hypothetical protein BDZ97DRAFT_1366163 [Flammula alnicola]